MLHPALVMAHNAPIYEKIGRGYAHTRRPDSRWQSAINQVLGEAQRVINVGAGAGSYEPADRMLIAVDPSITMIAQRPPGSAPVICAVAEQLPFADRAFDVAMAILTTHHWTDARIGLREMSRVADRVLVVTWDAKIFATEFWLMADYLPEVAEREQSLATLKLAMEVLPNAEAVPLPVPADCTDGVLGAYWQRPEAYLQDNIRAAMSGLALTDAYVVERAMARLAEDIKSGAWQAKYAALLELDELDLGYRLVRAS